MGHAVIFACSELFGFALFLGSDVTIFRVPEGELCPGGTAISDLVAAADVFRKAIKETVLVNICAAAAIVVTTIHGVGIALAALTVGEAVENAIIVDICAATSFAIALIDCIRLTSEAAFVWSKPVANTIVVDVQTAAAFVIEAIGLTRVASADFHDDVVPKHVRSGVAGFSFSI
jgi:hypothetical protein